MNPNSVRSNTRSDLYFWQHTILQQLITANTSNFNSVATKNLTKTPIFWQNKQQVSVESHDTCFGIIGYRALL